jgi:hypothetical protein
MGLTEEIREFICKNYIQPAREKGKSRITIRAGDIHSAMRLFSRMPAVCSALSKKIEQMCGVKIIDIKAPPSGQGANFFVTYVIGEKGKEEDVEEEKEEIILKEKEKKISWMEFEDTAREIMSEYFNTALTSVEVPGIPKKFDMVSEDKKIVGDAKYFTLVRGVAIPPAKFSVIAEHIWLLEKTKAEKKFLVFGNDRRVPIKWLEKYGRLVEEEVFFFFINENGELEYLKVRH